jgi:hypothetical protein
MYAGGWGPRTPRNTARWSTISSSVRTDGKPLTQTAPIGRALAIITPLGVGFAFAIRTPAAEQKMAQV